MRAIIQRVSEAQVMIKDEKISHIGKGLLIFLGIVNGDDKKDIDYIANKTGGLRIFKDNNKNMNLSIKEIGGSALVVSQFTLCADTKRGRRPSFVNAAPPIYAKKLYEKFCDKLHSVGIPVFRGKFGAMMKVDIINDGPNTTDCNKDYEQPPYLHSGWWNKTAS